MKRAANKSTTKRPTVPEIDEDEIRSSDSSNTAICRVCGAALTHGTCPACQWRAKRYAPVVALSAARTCECGAPIKVTNSARGGRFALRCGPCKKMLVKEKRLITIGALPDPRAPRRGA